MNLKTDIKVGMLILAAIVAFGCVYWFLGGIGLKEKTYHVYALFNSAKTMDKGADVRMAGVRIGNVESIELTDTNKARINLLILNNVKIPADSTVAVTNSGVIGDNYVDVIPGKSSEFVADGGQLMARSNAELADLLDETSELLATVKKTAEGLNNIIYDKENVASIKGALKSLKDTTDGSAAFVQTANDMLKGDSPLLTGIMQNLESTTDSAAKITNELDKIVHKKAEPGISNILDNANDTMKAAKVAAGNLNEAIIQAQQFIAGLQGATGGVSTTINKVNTLLDDADKTVQNLTAITKDVKDVTGDPKVKQDLLDTLDNTAETTREAKEFMKKINLKTDNLKIPKINDPAKASVSPKNGFSMRTLYNFDTDKARVDADYILGINDKFYRFGGYDLGEDAKLNLQMGKRLNDKSALRAGVYASRLGIGYDYKLSDDLTLSADVFRPNRPEMELRAIYNFNKRWGIVAGTNDLFHKDNRAFMMGAEYSF